MTDDDERRGGTDEIEVALELSVVLAHTVVAELVSDGTNTPRGYDRLANTVSFETAAAVELTLREAAAYHRRRAAPRLPFLERSRREDDRRATERRIPCLPPPVSQSGSRRRRR